MGGILFGGLLVVGMTVGLYVFRNPEKAVLNDELRQQLGGSYIRLSDGVTHYTLEGPLSGPRIVLVHGGTVPLWMWDDLAAALISAGYTVLRYDAYGRGFSDRPAIDYTRACYQRQLMELVDALGWTAPFDLVGYSLGGATATNFTAQFPSRVRRLVLISPVMRDYPLPQAFRPPFLGEWLARMLGIRKIISRVQHWLSNVPDGARKVEMFAQQATYVGFQYSLLSMLRHDAFSDYSAMYHTVGKQERDVLLVWGTEDREIPPEIIEAIRAMIPQIQYIPIPHADHGVVFQAAEAVTTTILNFLKGNTENTA